MVEPDELEQMAEHLEASGAYRILRRVPEIERYADDDPAATKRLGLIIDVETTGLDPAQDRIIELAVLPFHFSSEGLIFDVLPGYAGFEDPGMPLPETITRLTGISDDDVRGHRFDDDEVARLAGDANLIIAHNAAFDRRFLERRFPSFVTTFWACTMEQLPWADEGIKARSLDHLLNRLGWFFDDHRAMNDCRALLHLLSLDLPTSGRLVLKVLLETARQPLFRVWAIDAPFDHKDRLKLRGYRWNNGDDGRPKAWFRDVDELSREDEERFLVEEIYAGQTRHRVTKIRIRDRFSDRE